jgi:hypothetical protein
MFARLLFILTLFCSNFLIGQVEKNPPATNNASVPMESEKEVIQQDSSSLQLNFKGSKYKNDNSDSKKTEIKKESISTTVQKKSVEFSNVKAQSSIQRTQKTPTADKQSKMDETVDYLQSAAPESFEYHFFNYLAGNYDVSRFASLQKAYQLQSYNQEVQLQMAAYYWITGNKSKTLEFLNLLVKSNRISLETIQYSKDILLSAQENGTLITHGIDDTYGCLYLQLNENLRTDVTLISLDFLQSEAYQSNLKLKGYSIQNSKLIDVNYLKKFTTDNENKLISISLTTPKEYFQSIQEQLYVVGLAFEFHSQSFNNYYKNEYLWNEVLEKKVANSAQSEKAKSLSSNYLLMLLQLRDVYINQKENQKVKEIDKEIDKISIQSKKYEQVQKIKKKY